jgi:fructuronate reductase
MTADVRPWEEAKLRLLNAAHSAISYLGALSGAEFVHEAVSHSYMVHFVEKLWDEAATTFVAPASLDIRSYRLQLMSRLQNTTLAHRTHQIATDGSQKIPQRWLDSIAARLNQNRSIDALSLAVAGWMRWQRGIDEKGNAYEVNDPLAARTRAAWTANNASAVAGDLLSIQAIFPPELVADSRFRGAVCSSLDGLLCHGAEASLVRHAAAEVRCW